MTQNTWKAALFYGHRPPNLLGNAENSAFAVSSGSPITSLRSVLWGCRLRIELNVLQSPFWTLGGQGRSSQREARILSPAMRRQGTKKWSISNFLITEILHHTLSIAFHILRFNVLAPLFLPATARLPMWSWSDSGGLTLSLPRVIYVKFPPQPHQNNQHHRVWRIWLFIAYSDEGWSYYQFSLHHLYISLWRLGGCNLGVKGIIRGRSTLLVTNVLKRLPRQVWNLRKSCSGASTDQSHFAT